MPATTTAPTPAGVKPMKIAIFVSEAALKPVETAREMIQQELGLGEAPPLDIMLECALLGVDSDELATRVQAALLTRMGKKTQELPLEDPRTP